MLVWSMHWKPSILLTTASCLKDCWKEGCPNPLFVFWCAGTWLRGCRFNGLVEPLGILGSPTGSAKVMSLAQFCLLIYLDNLLETLRASGRGAGWEDHFSGALCYADNLTILAPSPDALRKMLTICEEFAQTHGIVLKASKTQIICFRRSIASVSTHFSLCGQRLPLVDSVVYLRNTLQYNLSDKLDIQSKSMTFIRQANSVLFQFHGCDPATKMELFKIYCLSLYSCALWKLNAHDHALNVSFTNVIRQIWKLPYNCHTSIIAHSVGLTTSIYNIIYSRFIRLLFTAVSHPSKLICSVFHDSPSL